MTQETRRAGAHVLTERAYDASTGRLTAIQTAGGYLQDLHYEYDNLGNVSARADQTNLANLREEFHYDALQRLTGSSIFDNAVAQPGGIVNQYWGDGNVRNKAGLGEYAYRSLAPGCDGISGSVTPGPHAVSQVSGTNYCYNANGSLIRTFNGTTSDKSLSWTAYDAVTMITSAQLNTKVGFDYGPNRERIRRLDYGSASAASAQTVTHFVGSAEIRYTANGTSPGGFEEVRRYVGGMIIVQSGALPVQTTVREYLLTDSQGSTYAVLDDYGMPINANARMSFDAFGQRRVAIGENAWEAPMPWSITLGDELDATTRHGYTGHEQVDALGIIHMGGRIYDPKIGRFLQADPFIQAPGNSQSLNRYSYVFNNPMAYTDPTGYWGAREQGWLKVVVAVVASVVTYGAASGWAAGMMSTGVTAGTMSATTASVYAGAVGGAAAGFTAGAITSGSMKGAVTGAFSGALFGGVGGYYGDVWSWERVGVESIAGGVSAEVNGGDFRDGFKFTAVMSTLTLANYHMRASERELSSINPDNLGTDSAGFFGDKKGLAGARRQVDPYSPDGRYLRCVSPAGGCQGQAIDINDYAQPNNFFGIGGPYKADSVRDRINESFAGPHDWLRNHVSRAYITRPAGPYDVIGNGRVFTGFRLRVDQFANAALIPVAAPFAASALLMTQRGLYTGYQVGYMRRRNG